MKNRSLKISSKTVWADYKRNYAVLISLWTVFVSGLYLWNLFGLNKEAVSLATVVARTNLDKDLIIRRWATMHGGVYVVPSEHTPPNPYLKVPGRDVVTTTGKKLTLMNPAYIVRELQDDYDEEFKVKSRITSLKTLNPVNNPDEWEKKALLSFKTGVEEILDVQKIDGVDYLRLIRPMHTEQGCLKCHGHQGYKVGDIRGGVSTSVPLNAFSLHFSHRKRELALSHFFIWLTGLLGFVFWYRRGIEYSRERLSAEETLEKSEESLKEAQRLTHLGSWDYDIVNNTLVWSDEFYRIYEIDPTQFGVSYEAFLDAVHPEDREYVDSSYRDSVANHTPYDIIHRLQMKDGRIKYIHEIGETTYGDNGTPLRSIGTGQDITDRKIAEDRIIESEKKFRLMIENSPVAIYVSIGIEQKAVYLNPAFTRMFGYTIEEVPTVADWWPLAYPDEKYREAVSQEWQDKVDKALKTNTSIEPMEVVVTCKDGSKKVIQWGYVSTGEQNWAFGLDLTDRKHAEEKLQILNEELELRVRKRTSQLEAANKELETFSYSVSHDLRTPLRAIDGFSLILLEDYYDKLDDEGKRLLNVIRNNTNRMSTLIDGILKISRTGRVPLSYSKTDVKSIVASILESLEIQIKEKNVKVQTGNLPEVYGDSELISQVFENLITNAIKFSENSRSPEIKIDGRIEEGKAIYYIKDNGVGFDMKYVSKLFGVFQRLHGVEEFEGTGIGLAIVKQIVSRHGGEVWAESQQGQGATFYFWLPLSGSIPPGNTGENASVNR